MNRKKWITVFCLFSMFLASACSIVTLAPGGGTTSEPGAGNGDSPPVTNTPEISPTTSLTPTITLTATSTIPLVSVSTATYCRTGNGPPFDLIYTLAVGVKAEVVGRSPDEGSWIIKIPDNPSQTCWLWNYYATVEGDTSHLPVVPFPPTPTPSAAFTVSYLGLVGPCGGGQYALRFMLANTGSLTLESIRIQIVDNTTATTLTHQRDFFRSFEPSCAMGDFNYDLAPGESSKTANVNPGQFYYNPIGHSLTTTITVCSLDAMAGTCLTKTLNITP